MRLFDRNRFPTNSTLERTETLMAEVQKKRRRRFGDRSDGRKVRTINPMNKLMPYIMPMRCDACNTYADMFDVTKTDRFCREKVKEGKTFAKSSVVLRLRTSNISEISLGFTP